MIYEERKLSGHPLSKDPPPHGGWRVTGKTKASHLRIDGTVSLTAVGMFGNGGGWGIPVSNHTLQITRGGLERLLQKIPI